MKPQISPLLLLDFAILNSNYKFIASPENIDIQQIFSSYELDLDYAILQQQELTKVFIKVSINQDETKLPGYSVFAEGVAVFNLSKTANLSEADKNSLLHYSSVSIALNSLRGFIASLTANAPYGRYMLPSIDVNDLFRQKSLSKIKHKVKKRLPKA